MTYDRSASEGWRAAFGMLGVLGIGVIGADLGVVAALALCLVFAVLDPNGRRSAHDVFETWIYIVFTCGIFLIPICAAFGAFVGWAGGYALLILAEGRLPSRPFGRG